MNGEMVGVIQGGDCVEAEEGFVFLLIKIKIIQKICSNKYCF